MPRNDTITAKQLAQAGWTVAKKARSYYVLQSPAGEEFEVDYSSEQPGSAKWMVDLVERRDGFSCSTLGAALYLLREFYNKPETN